MSKTWLHGSIVAVVKSKSTTFKIFLQLFTQVTLKIGHRAGKLEANAQILALLDCQSPDCLSHLRPIYVQ